MSSSGGSGGEVMGLELLENQLVTLQTELIDPVDDITADGEIKWLGQEPAYHDLDVVTYTKYDAHEWEGRVKKYKMEVTEQGNRVRRLENQVKHLKEKLAKQTAEVEEAKAGIDEIYQQCDSTKEQLELAIDRKRDLDRENLTLRRHLDNERKAIKKMDQESGTFFQRMAALEAEMAQSKERYENCLGEKEKLRLEREWFFRERLFLEETTAREEKDAVWDELKMRLAKLRHAMHKSWQEPKRDDLRGQLRAVHWTPLRQEWWESRKRMYNAKDVLIGRSATGTKHHDDEGEEESGSGGQSRSSGST